MALSKSTKDHDEIQQWAESHGAIPPEVSSTHSSDEPGILRFQFPNAKNKNDSALQEISWDDFFEKFDESDLTLVYQEKRQVDRKAISINWSTRRTSKLQVLLKRNRAAQPANIPPSVVRKQERLIFFLHIAILPRIGTT